eukprot:gene9451-1693_t
MGLKISTLFDWMKGSREVRVVMLGLDAAGKTTITDSERFQEARRELHGLLESDELRNACLLVFANKQDAPYASKTTQIAEALGLSEITNRQWYIQASSAISGEGLYEGMDWLSRVCSQRK